jgi:hypothetical protein
MKSEITKLPTINQFAGSHAKGKYSEADYQQIQTLLDAKLERFDELNDKEQAKIDKAEEKIKLNEAKRSEYVAYQDMLDMAMAKLSASIDNEDLQTTDWTKNSGIVIEDTVHENTVEESTKVM